MAIIFSSRWWFEYSYAEHDLVKDIVSLNYETFKEKYLPLTKEKTFLDHYFTLPRGDGPLPLHAALLNSNARGANFMLRDFSGYCSLKDKDKQGQTPLVACLAAEGKNPEEVADLFCALLEMRLNENAKVEMSDEDIFALFKLALTHQHYHLYKVLEAHQFITPSFLSKPTAVYFAGKLDKGSEWFLHLVGIEKNPPKIFTAKNLDTTNYSFKGFSFLHSAAYFGDARATTYLLSLGANLSVARKRSASVVASGNAADKTVAQDALFIAARYDKKDVVILLLENSSEIANENFYVSRDAKKHIKEDILKLILNKMREHKIAAFMKKYNNQADSDVSTTFSSAHLSDSLSSTSVFMSGSFTPPPTSVLLLGFDSPSSTQRKKIIMPSSFAVSDEQTGDMDIHAAIKLKDKNCVEKMVELGADFALRNAKGYNAFELALALDYQEGFSALVHAAYNNPSHSFQNVKCLEKKYFKVDRLISFIANYLSTQSVVDRSLLKFLWNNFILPIRSLYDSAERNKMDYFFKELELQLSAKKAQQELETLGLTPGGDDKVSQYSPSNCSLWNTFCAVAPAHVTTFQAIKLLKEIKQHFVGLKEEDGMLSFNTGGGWKKSTLATKVETIIAQTRDLLQIGEKDSFTAKIDDICGKLHRAEQKMAHATHKTLNQLLTELKQLSTERIEAYGAAQYTKIAFKPA